jgi:transposase
VESAGHYHRSLVARLRAGGYEVVELNPAAVKESRAQQLLARLKSDARDLGAMAELMVRGAGRQPALRTDALATQAAWVAHRRRKVTARVALANQVIGELDLVFPGLDACFKDVLRARAGLVIVAHIADPDRVRRQGVEGLRRFVARRGVALSRPKAAEVLEAARVALRLPGAERAAMGRVLGADLALLAALEAEIVAAEGALAGVLGDTPAGILQSLPGIAVVRASNYGAGIGDPARFPVPQPPTGPPASSRPSTSPPGAPGVASTSRGRDPWSCARPSSSSAGACPSTTPISRPTASDCSTMPRSLSWLPSRSGTGLTAWPSPCCGTSPRTTPAGGRSRWRRAGPPWRRPREPARTT